MVWRVPSRRVVLWHGRRGPDRNGTVCFGRLGEFWRGQECLVQAWQPRHGENGVVRQGRLAQAS